MRDAKGWLGTGALALAAAAAPGCDFLLEDGVAVGEDEYAYEEDGSSYEDPGPSWVDVAAAAAWAALWEGDGDGNDGADAPAPPPYRTARMDMVRTDGGPDGDARGRVEVLRRGRREWVRFRARRLEPGTPWEAFVADRSGSPVPFGSGVADSRGTAFGVVGGSDASPLPAGAASVAELATRPFQVRDGSGRVLLRGLVPGLGTGEGTRRGAARFASDDGTVSVRVRFVEARGEGRQRATLEAAGLPPGAAVAVAADPFGAGTVPVAGAVAGPDGTVRISRDTRRGDPLPGGVPFLGNLAGRAFEVRAGGEVLVAGTFPDL
jgi:hypothetical protein